MEDAKKILGAGSTGPCFELAFGGYARFICAVNLQCIAELIKRCWAFSIALDMATHMAAGCYDHHIRIRHKFTLHDFHLLPIPIHERHTGENVLNIFAWEMGALYATWCTKITKVATNGERMMTGQRQGVVSRMQNVAKPGFVEVWCGAHQLDFRMQAFYLDVPESLYSILTTLMAYLRLQKNFMSQDRSRWPLIWDTRWLSMIKVTIWVGKHQLCVAAYLEKTRLQARRSVVDSGAHCPRECRHCCPGVQNFAQA